VFCPCFSPRFRPRLSAEGAFMRQDRAGGVIFDGGFGRGGGHAAETPSSRFATPSLRYGRFAMTASQRRGYLPPCPFGGRSGHWAASPTKRTWWPMAIDARSGQGSRSPANALAFALAKRPPKAA